MRHKITFHGHSNVRSLHAKTIEITRDTRLTLQGDCIIGVGAQSGCGSLPDDLKSMLRRSDTRVRITISVNDRSFDIEGNGDSRLSLTHEEDIVIRKSRYVCSRTMAVKCNAAADDIPREMVHDLQNPDAIGVMTVTILD